MKRKAYVLLVTVLLACGEDEKPNTPPVASFEFSDGIDRIILDGELSTDPDGDPLAYHWTASDGAVTISNAANGSAFFKIPAGAGEMDMDVTLTVSDGGFQDIKSKTIEVPAFSLIRAYGLGRSLDNEVSNSVGYEWYFDQANTGVWSLVNCGPASVTMAIKWFDQSFTGTPQDARNTFQTSGGWWYTLDIISYLNKFNVNNRTIALDEMSRVKSEIDEGHIVILCLDMFFVNGDKDPDYHVNKFYYTNATGWGHFIVVKGYKEIDGQILYETYDPYSFNHTYTAGGLKGKDRYYTSADLDVATSNWWDYAIVVERSNSQGGRKGIDTDQIIHMPGQ